MADEAAADAQMSLALDPPFTRPRASYGARERFRAHFRALIYPVISELEMWTAKERLQSAQLLELLLIFTEARPDPNPTPNPNPNRVRTASVCMCRPTFRTCAYECVCACVCTCVCSCVHMSVCVCM